MKPYTKTYYDFFGYSVSEFVPCEVCGSKAVDIHHIWARSVRKELENEIVNLMALCRDHHYQFGDKKQYRDYLQEIHNEKINERRRLH